MLWSIILIVAISPFISALTPYRPKTVDGTFCMIPFENNGKTYHDCTSEGATKPFCKKPDNTVADCASGFDFSRCSLACPTTTVSEVQSILDLLNNIRSQEPALRMGKLRWNSELARRSQYMSDQCRIDTDNSNLCSLSSPMGRMSYMTSSSVPQPKKWNDFIQSFYSQKSSYNIDTDTCTASNCNGYKQLVNAETMDVGCAVSSCNQNGYYTDYYFCNFYPPVYNGKPYEKAAQPCDKCYKLSPDDTFRCTNNLCEKCDTPASDCVGYVSGPNCFDLQPLYCKLNSGICPKIELLSNASKAMFKSTCGRTCKIC